MKRVERTPIVRLGQMIHLFVNAAKVTSETLCRAAGMSVKLPEIVHNLKNVKDLNAKQFAEKEVLIGWFI